MLLHWCNLEPSRPSQLAAIRFSSAVRVQSIRIFPTGTQPFSQNPEILSRTKPDAFFLEVFFNAAPTDPKQKHKATNALVPTMIAFAGRQVDFAVDMGQDYVTRLIILRGNFESISLAIYGDIVSEIMLICPTYTAKPLPFVEPTPLSRALDPSIALEPMFLSQQFLTLITNSPPLPLAIRLVFCLKPSNEDWNSPDFPYIHADLQLDEDCLDFDLEKAHLLIARPVADDITHDVLEGFAKKVASCIGPRSTTQSYHLAELLLQSASQHCDMARTLVQSLDLSEIFDPSNMDEQTIWILVDAAANVDIARALNSPEMINTLVTIDDSPCTPSGAKNAASELLTRLRGWSVLEDAMSNTQGDFVRAAEMLKEAASNDASFGILLESLISHPELVAKLRENHPVLAGAPTHPPLLWSATSSAAVVSHDEFICFLRAYIGISCVVAVFAWADSLPNKKCREHTLATIRLWQDVPGYREIVNHLLLLRQMTFRLECIIDNDLPTPSGVDAEHIIMNLVSQPEAMVDPGLIKCIRSLRQPLSYITEKQRLSLCGAADIADGGLQAAVEAIIHLDPEDTLDSEGLHKLHVAVKILVREVSTRDLDGNEGEWRLLRSAWDAGSHGIVPYLIDEFLGIRTEINGQFGLKVPPHRVQSFMGQLFHVADDLLRLIIRLLPTCPLSMRPIQALTIALADLFVCADDADMTYAQGSSACIAAQTARQACIDGVRALSALASPVAEGKSGSELVFRTLIEYGLSCENRDPAHHLVQVFWLLDYVLPETNLQHTGDPAWIRQVATNALPQLKSFFQALEAENRVHFLKRLVILDGTIGIGEWLLSEAVKDLLETTRAIYDPFLDHSRRIVYRYHVSSILRFVHGVVQQPSSSSTWCMTMLADVPETARILADCFLALLDQNISFIFLDSIVEALAPNSSLFDPALQVAILLVLLRAARSNPASYLSLMSPLLKDISPDADSTDRLRHEIGATLAALVETIDSDEDPSERTAEAVLSLLEWITTQSDPSSLCSLPGLTAHTFSVLCASISKVLLPDRASFLDSIVPKVVVSDVVLPMSMTSSLTTGVELSIQSIEDLIMPVMLPSTPLQKALHSQDVLGLVSVSPHTALLRSPITGLTKTYSNNDFRQLRQTPSSRQNIGRLPSTHVDDFELGMSSPQPLPGATVSPLNLFSMETSSPLGAPFFLR